jgi:hypothetical protein
MDAPRRIGVLGIAPPLLSIFLPEIKIHVTTNTFIRFSIGGATEFVGMVIGIKVAERAFTVRRFLSSQQLHLIVNNLRSDVSFWPRLGQSKSPSYVCDSDIIVEVVHAAVKGLAFVFFESDPLVRQVQGMANVFVASSFLNTKTMTLWHCQSFSSFPSTSPHRILSYCFPSNIFNQLIAMKAVIQSAMNTRGKNKRNRVVCKIGNFSRCTWDYIKLQLLLDVEASPAVVKTNFILRDELVVEKWRTVQEQVNLTLPEHLQSAQKVFGTSVGIGVRVFLPCSMGKNNGIVAAHRVISKTDTINVVPFEPEDQELIRRGIVLKYIPSRSHLTVTIRFRRVTGEARMLPYLQSRGAIYEEEEEAEDVWPLHSDTPFRNSVISKINLREETVTLKSGELLHFHQCINDISSRI